MKIAIPAVKAGRRVSIYSPRIQNTKQLIEYCQRDGVRFGVKASSFPKLEDPEALLQICSLQTVFSRMNDFRHEFPFCDILIMDEAHQQTGDMAQSVIDKHRSTCTAHIGFTATPVDLGVMYHELVTEVSNKELLECKSHLPALCYGPDRPDLSKLRAMASGEFSSRRDGEVNKVPTIVGRVFDNWKKLNPDQLPTIGFAPGVKHSKHYVD